MKTRPLHRLAARLALALAALLTAALLAPAAFADAGDYDEITNYVVTVDPRQDGSADITYEIDWKVIGGGAEDSLSWVTIGLANEYADEFENLSPDTVADVSLLTEGGSYAQVTFHDHYYAPDVAAQNGGESEVSFRFRVHQSHLFTENDDDTASFSFTPGWFDEICVDRLTVRWRNYDGFLADNHSVDGDYLVWEFGPLAHGERATVNVTVPITTAQVFDPANAMTGQENTPARPQSTGSRYDGAVALMTLLVVLFFAAIFYAGRPARWRGGFGGRLRPGRLGLVLQRRQLHPHGAGQPPARRLPYLQPAAGLQGRRRRDPRRRRRAGHQPPRQLRVRLRLRFLRVCLRLRRRRPCRLQRQEFLPHPPAPPCQ